MDFSQILARTRPGKMLFGAISNGRVANAYLFLGPLKSLKHEAALAFAAALTCDAGKRAPCGECRSCAKIKKGVHPDVFVVKSGGKSIKIDQIRELIAYSRIGPSEAKWKVCLIEDVLLMTPEAANAFLKTLEEPVPGVVFLLMASSDTGIPGTIISRCQKILFPEEMAFPGKVGRDDMEKDVGDIVSAVTSAGDVNDLLKVSALLAEDREGIEERLSALAEKLWEGRSPESIKDVKAVIGALSAIRRHANARLALDAMCLSFGGR